MVGFVHSKSRMSRPPSQLPLPRGNALIFTPAASANWIPPCIVMMMMEMIMVMMIMVDDYDDGDDLWFAKDATWRWSGWISCAILYSQLAQMGASRIIIANITLSSSSFSTS